MGPAGCVFLTLAKAPTYMQTLDDIRKRAGAPYADLCNMMVYLNQTTARDVPDPWKGDMIHELTKAFVELGQSRGYNIQILARNIATLGDALVQDTQDFISASRPGGYPEVNSILSRIAGPFGKRSGRS